MPDSLSAAGASPDSQAAKPRKSCDSATPLLGGEPFGKLIRFKQPEEIRGRCRREWCGLWPLRLGHVFAEHQSQVAFADDQDPAQRSRRMVPLTRPQMAFNPGVFGEVVITRSLLGPEHLTERGVEDRITIMNQEPQRPGAVPASMARLRAAAPPTPRSGARSPLMAQDEDLGILGII